MAKALALAALLLVAAVLLLAGGAEAGAGEVPLSWVLGVEDVADDGYGFATGGDAVARRVLQNTGYISYGALRRDNVPCSVRGTSYYNCRPGGQANPYNRGCSAITRCRGKVLIFDPSGCEKQVFHIVMNHAPNAPKTGISHDRSFLRETRRRDCESHDNNSRKTKKMTLLDSPSPRSAEGVTSPEVTMNSGGLQEMTEPHYILAMGCNLTTAQKAEVDALVKKVRPVIPFYITAMNKTSMSGSLVICKDYAAKYLPHDDQFITLCHPHKSNIWIDNLKVITDGSRMLSVGWSCFVLHNELRESDICLFEVLKSEGEVTMVVHSLEGGHHLQGKQPKSQNKRSYPVKVEATEDEESDKEHAESNYYYSRYAHGLTSDEQEKIFRSALIQQGNPVYVAVLGKNHVKKRNNLLTIPRKFAAKHLAARSHDILLLRPNRGEKWCVRYYYHSGLRGFNYSPWAKFVRDNKLREGHICVFELIKGMRKATMIVHVFKKVDGRLVLLD